MANSVSETAFEQAKAFAEQAISTFVVASIYYLGLDPRKASLHFDIAIDRDKLDAKASVLHPRDVEVSVFYTTDGDPEDADRPASQN